MDILINETLKKDVANLAAKLNGKKKMIDEVNYPKAKRLKNQKVNTMNGIENLLLQEQ